jgi:hypothetical protein
MKRLLIPLAIILIASFVVAVPVPCSQEDLLNTSNYAIEGVVTGTFCGTPYDSRECIPFPEDVKCASIADNGSIIDVPCLRGEFQPELVSNCIATIKVTKNLKGNYNKGIYVDIPFLELVQESENGTCAIPGSPKLHFEGDSKIRYYDSSSCKWSNFEELEQNVCIEEGEWGSLTPEGFGCCSGLDAINPTDEAHNCVQGMGYYCTKCGDGICKNPENTCNCQEDCGNFTKFECGNRICEEGECSYEQRLTCSSYDQTYCSCFVCSQDCGGTNRTISLSEEINKTLPGQAKIKILPETASLRARERLGELGFNITLKEVGEGNQTKWIYSLEAEKKYKIFGFIKKTSRVSVEVDAETGEVIGTKKPWWAFLATSD